MKLDRNPTTGTSSKYGLILNRKLAAAKETASAQDQYEIDRAISLLERTGIIDWGDTVDTEFFVVKLRDINAGRALWGYADSAVQFDQEYGHEMGKLASRAGIHHPNPKVPD